jgi:hypothetical protein
MLSKKGRKSKNEMYFGPDEEEAVIKFLESTDDVERNLIFNEWLKAPLDKMIESIIRRYKLYRKGETFDELHSDTVSFLMTKVHKFESGLGKKAYSYFGTISKNYILGLLIKDEKYLKLNISYEDISSDLDEREDLMYELDEQKFLPDEFISSLIFEIKEDLLNEPLNHKLSLTENEKKVGYALIDMLENWEKSFESMKGGTRYNKNSVLETMRNYTNLTTKDIRVAMKRFKSLYKLVKNKNL